MVEKNYYVRRIAQALITVWAAITFPFVTIRLIPGGPMDYIAVQIRQQSREAVSSIRLNQMTEMYSNINPDKPMLQTHVEYIVSVAQLDFGRSIFYADPVWNVLGPAIPWMMFVSLFALVIGTIMVFLIDGFLAVHEGDTWDVVRSHLVIFSDTVPYYIVGLVLLFTLGFGTEFFPNGGRYDNAFTPEFNIEFMASVLRHAALPVMSFALTSWGGLESRAHYTHIIGENYVDVAELRGLSDSRIQLRYIGRNSMLPMYTGLMAGLASLFGGSVIMEQIFRYRGMGFYFHEATMARDCTTVMAAVILFTIVTVIGLFIADFTYDFIDPRAGHTQRESCSRSYHETLQRFVNRLRGGGADETEAIDDHIEGNRISTSGVVSFGVNSSDFSRGEYIRERIDQSLLIPSRIIQTSPKAQVGAIILGIFGFLGPFGQFLVPEVSPIQGPILLQPLENMRYPLGIDDIGRDLLAQQVFATRPMLVMMLSGVAVTLSLAILLGVTAGYLGGATDRVLMTVTDMMMNIPGLALVIALAVILEPKSPVFVGVVLAIDNWPRLARQLRSQVLTIRNESHVEASRVLGLPTSSIPLKNVMSRLMPMLTMGIVGSMRDILMGFVGLYFIGVLLFTASNRGVVPNITRNGGALFGMDRFHWLLTPTLFIVTMTYGLQLFAQGTGRLFNPRLRARHAATVLTDDMEGGRGGSEGDDGAASAAS